MTLTLKQTKLEPKRIPLIPSYPPFRQWKKSALDDKLKDRSLSLYLHIPFCTQRCAFCYYKTVDLKERPEVEGYVDALCQEIKMVAEGFQLSNRPIHAVYIGGGTPSLLKEHQFVKIVEALTENFKFFNEKKQFSVEAEPLTVSRSKMATLVKLGVNRLSMGIQSFVDEIIKLSGRGHDEKQAYRAIDIAQQEGNGKWNINIDLLSGLTGETDETWQKSLDCAIATGVESITVYKMEAFANTQVFKEGIREEILQLPSEEQELKFMKQAMEKFAQANYLPWSFFTYTKNGIDRSEYTMSIWRSTDFYGFGVSAFGCLDYSLLQNTSDMEKYIATVARNEIPLARGYTCTSLDKMVREVLLGMKLLHLDLDEFKQRYGFNLKKLCASIIADLELDGLISVSENAIDLTSKGMLYGDFVGVSLSDYLRQSSDLSSEIISL
ncbi:MAG TPA: coproporphyrinogen III oxidase [Cyanobacteria bacterium UBA11149]|nr:coproporphyrinogen III oxidase [Cyanobacteria bacterium UBA11367]HBE55970.1 coproporphyrinogen III oxidase [Cyanobacteria bacterium UBA11366]HBK63198.1 coproporphyrinogen III oxidase [Cyanobacteria bacterium UBA11166]HBR74754.1 coproporphyrinogen III oxidase [Cyanobacteria bacterium UBA11159]HBS72523.1 coproporphyrinogen III oxidase [Cyanobacteria bacterium UBA11153]HBW88690.1 coproporphyrinogen III oxidase [Cyanobacteria bacterium UBA11149]HCA94504.1 coproporphyrinogen III oxidase [Cyanob